MGKLKAEMKRHHAKKRRQAKQKVKDAIAESKKRK